MMRRITAALLALIILLSVMPVTRANAEERIYKKGEVIRIERERVTEPYKYLPDNPTSKGYKWELQLSKNGSPLLECTKDEHVCERLLCWDENGDRICDGPHTHKPNSNKCTMGYVWKVVRDPDYILWYDDPLAPENYELAVCCYEPDGIVPMAGVGLRLFRVIDKEIQKEDGSTEVRTVNDSILPVDPEEPSGTQNPVTNKNGYYYFTGECKESIPAGDHTWYLIQMAEEFQEEGKYYNQYRSNTIKWEVDVHVDGEGTYTVMDIRDPNGISLLSEEEEDEHPKPVQGYDEENKRLVILNQPINVIINIDLINAPASLAQLDATITGPNGFRQDIQITKNSGSWHFSSTKDEVLKDVLLESGEYTVEAQTGRYPVVYMVSRHDMAPTEGNTLLLDKDHQNGFFEIHFASLSNTVKLYAVDENEKPVRDAVYGIYGDEDNFTTVSSDGQTVVTLDVNSWKELAQLGKTLTVKQIEPAPENHDLAENEYELLITETGDEVEPYTVELLPKKGDRDVRYGENNEQIGTFVNRKHDLSYFIIPGSADLETGEAVSGAVYNLMDLDTEEAWPGSGEPLNMKAFMAEKYGSGWQKKEFRMTQRTAPEGYDLSEDSYTVTVTEGENGAVTVEVKKDANVFKRIAMFFTGDGIGRGDFGEWKPVFTNVKRAIPHSNTVILRAVDGEGKGLKGAQYALFKDGEDLGIVFDASSTAEHVIDSDGWMNVAMQLYMNSDLPEEEKNALMSGGSLEVILKQTNMIENREAAQEEYPIEVRRARDEDNIEDDFFVKLKDASNGTVVQYMEDGTQIATFINEEMKSETAKIYLTLDSNIGIQWNDCEPDDDQRAYYKDRKYEFLLYWKDNYGSWQTDGEILSLVNNKSNEGVFTKELPVGTSYKICPATDKVDYNVTFSGGPAGDQTRAYEAMVSQTGNVYLNAKVKYIMMAGDYSPALNMVKVDGTDTKLTLKDVKFTLKDENGETIESYKTNEDGLLNINVAYHPTVYTLTENEAHEGYTKLKSPIHISVGYKYTVSNEGVSTVVYQDLVATAAHPDVTLGQDGWYYIKNFKEDVVDPSATAKIHLSLDDIKIQWNDSESDKDQRAYYNDRDYEFLLYWKDNAGKWQTDNKVLTLVNNNKSRAGTFEKELPVGTAFKVCPAAEKVDYNITFSGGPAKDQTKAYEAIVAQAGNIHLNAQIKYVMAMGDFSPSLHMIKVYARDTSKTLAGAKFTLKDEDADALETYKTGKDGILEITFGMLEDYPATYTLKENKAPDDYLKLKSVIHINVGYKYTAENEGGTVVVYQDLVATADHPDVTLGRDGWYYIKNTHKNDNPKTGDSFNAAAWMGALLVSGAALSYVLMTEAKKRGVR